LARLGAVLDVVASRLRVDAPTGAITDDVAARIRQHRDILIAAVIGRGTGHALAPCTACGRESMTNLANTTWPRCRLTPGCEGRHEPRPAELASITTRKRIKQATPPPRPTKQRTTQPIAEGSTW
jgi:hypothetical protein